MTFISKGTVFFSRLSKNFQKNHVEERIRKRQKKQPFQFSLSHHLLTSHCRVGLKLYTLMNPSWKSMSIIFFSKPRVMPLNNGWKWATDWGGGVSRKENACSQTSQEKKKKIFTSLSLCCNGHLSNVYDSGGRTIGMRWRAGGEKIKHRRMSITLHGIKPCAATRKSIFCRSREPSFHCGAAPHTF